MAESMREIGIIGGGIVGLATAYALVKKGITSLIVLEAEKELAAHQTGNNSGVIHSGLYYKPGSLKAKNCTKGREQMYEFCRDNDIPHDRCGKVVVATDENELPALERIRERGTKNGLKDLTLLKPEQIKEVEPNVQAVAGIFVEETGIVDFKAVSNSLAEKVAKAGGKIQKNATVYGIQQKADHLLLQNTREVVSCRNLVNCGGLFSDRIARMCGINPKLQILPFRGEYFVLRKDREQLVRNLIYPVPDPRFPFLGVHFTRMIEGGIEAGPNAVLALSRTGYRWRDISIQDLFEMAAFRGFWNMGRRYWRMGFSEMYRSLSKAAFVRALQKLIPEIKEEDVSPGGAGVRAQAVGPDGNLLDDFQIVGGDRMIHVLNAPSPAATASLSIGETIADMAISGFRMGSAEKVRINTSGGREPEVSEKY